MIYVIKLYFKIKLDKIKHGYLQSGKKSYFRNKEFTIYYYLDIVFVTLFNKTTVKTDRISVGGRW